MDNDSSHRASRLWSTARLLDQSISPAATGPHPSDATFGRLARSTWQPVRCNYYGELTPDKFFGDRPYCRGSAVFSLPRCSPPEVSSALLQHSCSAQLSWREGIVSTGSFCKVTGWRQPGTGLLSDTTQPNRAHTKVHELCVQTPLCSFSKCSHAAASLSQSTTHVRLFGQRSRIKA